MCWSATVEMGVLFIGRGVAYRQTGLHGILFISTIDPLQPPRATVHPPWTSSSLHGLLFIQPPSRATPPATVQPPLHGHPSTSTIHPALHTTGSCSTTPPWPPLHHLLFILPSTGWSCSSSPPQGPVHPTPTGSIDRGPVHPPHRELFIQTPQQRSLFIQRQHRSASVSSSSEGIARSGSVNSHRSIARVQ